MPAKAGSSLFGAVTACAFIPMVIFSLFGGVIADIPVIVVQILGMSDTAIGITQGAIRAAILAMAVIALSRRRKCTEKDNKSMAYDSSFSYVGWMHPCEAINGQI